MWLIAGATLIASSLAIGYHQDQRLADAALAAMEETPAPVAIQDISRNQIPIIPTETQLLAEVDLNDAVRHSIAVGDIQESYVLLPAYAVSDAGRDRANMLLRRNAEEGLSGQSGARPRSETGKPIPVGILVFDAKEDELPDMRFETMGLRPLGAGVNGEIILFSGTVFDRARWQNAMATASFDDAITAIIGQGEKELPVIALSRSVGAAWAHSPKLSALRGNIALLGVGLLFCGGLLALKRNIPDSRRRARSTLISPEEFLSVSEPQFFEPIASQDELQNEDAADQAPAIVSRVLSRTTGAFESTTTRVKSRL